MSEPTKGCDRACFVGTFAIRCTSPKQRVWTVRCCAVQETTLRRLALPESEREKCGNGNAASEIHEFVSRRCTQSASVTHFWMRRPAECERAIDSSARRDTVSHEERRTAWPIVGVHNGGRAVHLHREGSGGAAMDTVHSMGSTPCCQVLGDMPHVAAKRSASSNGVDVSFPRHGTLGFRALHGRPCTPELSEVTHGGQPSAESARSAMLTSLRRLAQRNLLIPHPRPRPPPLHPPSSYVRCPRPLASWISSSHLLFHLPSPSLLSLLRCCCTP